MLQRRGRGGVGRCGRSSRGREGCCGRVNRRSVEMVRLGWGRLLFGPTSSIGGGRVGRRHTRGPLRRGVRCAQTCRPSSALTAVRLVLAEDQPAPSRTGAVVVPRRRPLPAVHGEPRFDARRSLERLCVGRVQRGCRWRGSRLERWRGHGVGRRVEVGRGRVRVRVGRRPRVRRRRRPPRRVAG